MKLTLFRVFYQNKCAEEVTAAIKEAISATGATEIKDMGKVMGALKSKYTGQMDFGAASALIKQLLG